jgi:ribosomal protein S18 acetylase RimI-like enzyme
MLSANVVAGVEYGPLDASDVGPMAELLADVFSRHDPPAVAVGLPRREIEVLVLAFGPKALAERLTIIARAVSSRELLGALLVEDFATPPPDGQEQVAPTFAPIGAMLDGLDTQYRALRTIEPGRYLHLFMLGVAEHAWGRGIARQLIATSLRHGKERGYTHAVTEATGTISQHLFRTFGFREVLTAHYCDVVYAGNRPFAAIEEPIGTILMDRAL